MRREFGFWAPAKNHLPARPPTVPTSALHSPLWAPAVARYGWQRPTVASCGGPAHARESPSVFAPNFGSKTPKRSAFARSAENRGRRVYEKGVWNSAECRVSVLPARPAHARESSLGFRTKFRRENSQAVVVRQIG